MLRRALTDPEAVDRINFKQTLVSCARVGEIELAHQLREEVEEVGRVVPRSTLTYIEYAERVFCKHGVQQATGNRKSAVTASTPTVLASSLKKGDLDEANDKDFSRPEQQRALTDEESETISFAATTEEAVGAEQVEGGEEELNKYGNVWRGTASQFQGETPSSRGFPVARSPLEEELCAAAAGSSSSSSSMSSSSDCGNLPLSEFPNLTAAVRSPLDEAQVGTAGTSWSRAVSAEKTLSAGLTYERTLAAGEATTSPDSSAQVVANETLDQGGEGRIAHFLASAATGGLGATEITAGGEKGSEHAQIPTCRAFDADEENASSTANTVAEKKRSLRSDEDDDVVNDDDDGHYDDGRQNPPAASRNSPRVVWEPPYSSKKFELCAKHLTNEGDARGAVRFLRNAIDNPAAKVTMLMYEAGIKSAARGGLLDEAMNVLGWIRKAGLRPSSTCLVWAIRACGRAPVVNVPLALALLKEMDPPDIWGYSAALSTCARGGQWETNLSLLEAMPSAGLRANV